MAAQSKIQPFEEWQSADQQEKNAQRGKRKRSPAYSPSSERLPDHPWFRLDKRDIDAKIYSIVQEVIKKLENARPADKELMALREVADEASMVRAPTPIDTALVGGQAMGKSLALDALLNRHSLSKTGASGRACTETAITYMGKDANGASDGYYDAAVEFMNDTDRHDYFKEHIRRFHYFYFSARDDTDATDEDEKAAESAREFFELIFNVQNDETARQELNVLLTASGIENGTLFKALELKADRQIRDSGADASRIVWFHDMDLTTLKQKIHKFVARSTDDTNTALWPIVQDVKIYLVATLPEHGVHLTDLPGTGDTNQIRTAVTNAIRRKCGTEVIFADSKRVLTDSVVNQQLKESIRAHGAVNTVLLLTKIDECILDHSNIDTQINENSREPFPLIKKYHDEAEEELEEFQDREDLGEELDDDTKDREDNLKNYLDYLKNEALRAFIQQRAQDIEDEMRHKFSKEDPEPIKVFSISASMHLLWLSPRQQKRPLLTPKETGVPGFRQFMLQKTAAGNWQNYSEHMFEVLPAFIEKIARISQDEKKDESYAILRPRYMQQVATFKIRLAHSFEQFLETKMVKVGGYFSMNSKYMSSISKVVIDWGTGVVWSTYNKLLRERGIVTKCKAKKYSQEPYNGRVNWNEELSEQNRPAMDDWRQRMHHEIMSFAVDLHHTIVAFCQEVFEAILTSQLSPTLIRGASEMWNKHQQKILDQANQLAAYLRDQVNNTYQYATTETDVRCMVAKLNAPTYEAIEQMPRGGKDWFKSQKEQMHRAMTEPNEKQKTILDRIETSVSKTAKNNFRTAFATFTDALVRELDGFDGTIGDCLPPDYDITSADQDIRDSLKASIPELKKRVHSLQQKFSVAVVKSENVESQEDDDIGPSAKKQKLLDIPRDYLGAIPAAY